MPDRAGLRVLVVPGDMRPTRAEIEAADLVLKLKPASGRVSQLAWQGRGTATIKRFPDSFVGDLDA